MKNNYLNKLEELYLRHADPVRAIPMKKYMKDRFEFCGISSIPRKEIYKEFFMANGLPETGDIEDIVKELWEMPQREYQYFATFLFAKMIRELDKDQISIFEFMIVNKSWWDTVDAIAINLVGPVLARDKNIIPAITGKWMDSGNMWLQRTSLLFQLNYKSGTDEKLLFSLIKKLSEREEFFIRKAIGWALREYSKTSPGIVSEFITNTKLSPLSVKEGMRIILKSSNKV